jgi:hypothetical protein
MHKQKYVSQFLTHFVGRKETASEDQYKVLLKILRSGWLLAPSMVNTKPDELPKRVQQVSYSWPLNISDSDLNSVFLSDVVCFADIPLDDLNIHLEKYSPFGIAFRKDFLLNKGANPVFYISKNSKDMSEGGIDFEKHFHKQLQNYIDLQKAFFSKPKGVKGAFTSEETSQYKFHIFLLKYFLCFLKFWDSTKDDEDIHNFYMEREWRIYGGLNFDIDDVQRIIIPKQ